MANKILIIQPDQCMEVQFDQQITIGRDMYNSLCLQDPEVSRSHAIIFEQEGEITIKDLKSRNGVFVQGQRAGECALKSGDEIILGSTVLLFNPPEAVELQELLTSRGKYLIEKRVNKIPKESFEPVTVFTCEELDREIDSLFSHPESTTFFTLTNAIMLLKAIKELARAANTTALFECAVRRALEIVGGHRGVIMESDAGKQHLKVRAIVSVDDTDTILIGKPILKIVVGKEKCLFCPNVMKDKRFESVALNADRPLHSFVAVPILGQDRMFGFIYLDSQDDSVSYDHTALRSLYFIAFHLGALLTARPTHFEKAPASASSGA